LIVLLKRSVAISDFRACGLVVHVACATAVRDMAATMKNVKNRFIFLIIYC